MQSSLTPGPTPRLYRSRTDKMLGGVCGGLAAYFHIDPVVVRLAFVVLALAGGASILFYLLLWIVVPAGEPAPDGEHAAVFGGRGTEATAILLIGVGAVWLLANIGALKFVDWAIVWPLALVALGAVLLARGARP